MVYGYYTDRNGTECCPITVARCDTALDHISNDPCQEQSFVILLGAGKNPQHPDRPELKEIMRAYLTQTLMRNGYDMSKHGVLTKGSKRVTIRLAQKDGWGTFNETRSVVELLNGIAESPSRITVVSSRYHLMRIRFIWKFFPKYRISTVPFMEKTTLKHCCLEAIKFSKALLMGLHYKLS